MTERLAVLCARHPWRTVAAWIGAIVVAVVLVGALLGDNLPSEGNVTNDPESLRAYDLQSERFPQQEGFDELVIVRSEMLRVDDEPLRAKMTELATAVFLLTMPLAPTRPGLRNLTRPRWLPRDPLGVQTSG